MNGRGLLAPRVPRWVLWLEVVLVAGALIGIGTARFSRLTPAERLEIQLEAGLQQLFEMEADYHRRHRTYFAPDDLEYRPFLTWLSRYEHEVRHDPRKGYSVVVHADLDGDGEEGTWRIDEASSQPTRVVPD